MFKHRFTTNWEGAGDSLTGTAEIEANSELNFEFVVPANGSVGVIASVNANLLQSAYFLAKTGEVVVKTNSDSTPDNQFTLGAGVPLSWIRENGGANFFGANVSMFYLSTQNGADVPVSIRMLVEAID